MPGVPRSTAPELSLLMVTVSTCGPGFPPRLVRSPNNAPGSADTGGGSGGARYCRIARAMSRPKARALSGVTGTPAFVE